MSDRQIVQISTTGVTNTAGTQCDYIVAALCNDGSVWVLHDAHGDWYPLPAIPQPLKERDDE